MSNDVLDLPAIVQIETAMACNLRCPMCPVPTSKTDMDGRAPGIMPVETFDAIMSQLSGRQRVIGLTMMGEPLINKHIVRFVRTAREHGHWVALTTNGTLLTEEKSRALLAAGLNMVKVSFDGATKETYERIRIGAEFSRVVENVKRFDALRKELGSTCQLEVHCIESDLTRAELDHFEAMWTGIADTPRVIQLSDWVGQMSIPAEFGKPPAPPEINAAASGCHFLWDVLSISEKGKPVFCCFDYKQESDLPSVHEKSLIDTWNDEVAAERLRHIENRVHDGPCAKCPTWLRIKDHKEARAAA
jgi:pyruvate-formate lyase-activating enzyme